jgi:hypothetical protein
VQQPWFKVRNVGDERMGCVWEEGPAAAWAGVAINGLLSCRPLLRFLPSPNPILKQLTNEEVEVSNEGVLPH